MRRLLLLLILPLALSCNSQEKPVTGLASAAISLTKDDVTYDPSYFNIAYPMGDITADKGVCTDVIIRAYRKLGIDLQQLVHEDMKSNFSVYPKKNGDQADPIRTSIIAECPTFVSFSREKEHHFPLRRMLQIINLEMWSHGILAMA